jgi:hypothetical protein
MRRSYVVPMRWMVIYGYGVPGGALNLNSTNYPEHGHHGNPPLSGKNSGNRTRHLMSSSQKRWPLDHEAGRKHKYISRYIKRTLGYPVYVLSVDDRQVADDVEITMVVSIPLFVCGTPQTGYSEVRTEITCGKNSNSHNDSINFLYTPLERYRHYGRQCFLNWHWVTPPAGVM